MSESPLRNHALRYHHAGWHPLELPAHAKQPPPDGRTGAAGVDMTDLDIGRAAWAGNIGLRMPADVVGLDVDAYRSNPDTFAQIRERLGPLPKTRMSHNGRGDGSGIRYYLVPAGLAWTAGLSGIDVIQRRHRYAVVWPSWHPESRQYAWFDQTEQAATGDIPYVEDLPDLPWAWIAELSRAQQNDLDGHATAVDRTELEAFLDAHTQADAPGYITGSIVAHFHDRRQAGHSRHDTMQHCLTWALEHVRAGIAPALPTIETFAQTWAEALEGEPRRAQLWSGSTVTEFEAMVRHAIGKANQKTDAELHKLHDDVAGIPLQITSSSPPPEPAEDPVAAAAFVNGAAFVLDEPADLIARWGKGPDVLWACGESLLLCGPAGVGKTTIAGQLVGGLIGVLPDVLGYPVLPARKVLYLAMDRPRQIQRAFRRLFGPDHRQALADHLTVRRGPLAADLGNKPRILVELALETGADVVIVDSLKDAAVKLTDDTVGGNVNRAVQFCNVADIDVLVLHHQRKSVEGHKPIALEDVYGNTWITAGAGSVVLLWGDPGSELVELTHLKQPAELIGPLDIEHDHHRGTSRVTRGWDALTYLTGCGTAGTTIAAAAQAHHGAPQTAGKAKWKQTERKLRALVKTGLATSPAQTSVGSPVRYFALPPMVISSHSSVDTSRGQSVSFDTVDAPVDNPVDNPE